MTDFAIQRAFSKHLLGAALGDMSSWSVWLAVLRASFAQPLSKAEQQIFATVAGDRQPPSSRVRELWCVCGRRSGKSRMAAAIAVYQALFVKHKLARGEVGMCLVLAASQAQARTVFQYVRGFLEASPTLAREVVSVTRDSIELKNRIVVAVHSTSFRTLRGRTLVGCVFDETAYWRSDDSAAPDSETYSAVLPALSTTNGMLVSISTPYRKLGLMHQKHRDHFGVDGDDVLCVQGASQTFNPLLSDSVIAAQRAADPTAAGSEWDATFRTDISAFLDDALIDAAVEHGRPLELPPVPTLHYQAYTDSSGGVGSDAYTLAIGHRVGEHVIIDVVGATAGKFDPVQVTQEYAALLKQYRVFRVMGDRYGAEWVSGAWARCGVSYVCSELAKSEVYLEAAPLFARGLIRLPDHAKLLRELRLLERHTHRSGRDTIDHPKGGRDDHANAVCGVAWQLSANSSMQIPLGLLARIQQMPPNPKYAQHGGPSRYMQHGREQYYERLLGERRYGQARRGILPGMKPGA